MAGPPLLFRGDVPGCPVVKNPLCNAGGVGLIPGWETEIPHPGEHLSPRAAAAEACATKKDPTSCSEDPACCNRGLTQPDK